MNEIAWRLGVVAVVVATAAVVSVRRRNRTQPPTQPRAVLPSQLDRRDFVDPAAPWLLVVFSSATCSTCEDVRRKAAVLASGEVAVQDVEFSRDRALHDRYGIDAVPAVMIADPHGVVRFAHLGPISATDLWAAMARCRDPQLPPAQCDGDPS